MKKTRRLNLNKNRLKYGDVSNQWFRSMSEVSGLTDHWVGYLYVSNDCLNNNNITPEDIGIQMIGDENRVKLNFEI